MESWSEDSFCNTLYGEIQNEGSCGWYVRQSHKTLEKGFQLDHPRIAVLEIGCNLGEHSEYVIHPYDEYVASDYREIDFKPLNERTRFQVADAQDLPFDDRSFQRVIMTCVLHHLLDPEKAAQEMRRVADHKGVISILLPTDPGALYRLGKHIGPYRSIARKLPEMDAEYLHYQQHRNHFPALVSIIRHVFRNDLVRQLNWPLPWSLWNLNMYRVFQITIDKD